MKRLTIEEKLKVLEVYKKGNLSYKEIADKLGIWNTTVKYILKNNGVKLKSSSEAKRKYEVNENFFDIIDTEEKAYFLGFLYADGYNNTSRYCVRLILQEDDRIIIEKLNNLLQPSKPLYFEKGRFDKRTSNISKNKYGLIIANKHISETLSNFGCIRAKTFHIVFPQWLNSKLQRHFIRGYFDGDGCIYYNKNNKNFRVEMMGTDNLLYSIQNILSEELGFNKTKLYKKPLMINKNISSLIYGTNSQVMKIKDWLYKDATIYLDRKYNKFLQNGN